MKKFILHFLILLFLCTLSKVLYSQSQEQNSGVTANLTSVCLNPLDSGNNVWVCGNNGTVIKTTNSGTNWLNLSGNGIPGSINLVNIS